MDITAAPLGSIWRRWDLHIHAPGTKLADSFGDPKSDEVWGQFLDALEESPVEVFGITDYFCCDTYHAVVRRFRDRHPDSSKVFFPNAELRLAESISKDGSLPHIHVVFDNDLTQCPAERLSRFFTNLETHARDDDDARKRCSDLAITRDFESATVSLNDLLKTLKDTFGEAKPYLLV